MAIYVGETVTIVGAAFDPVAQRIINDALATVVFYAPGKNPIRNPEDRVPDFGPVPMDFNGVVVNKDGTIGAYVGYIGTAGWAPGKWHYRVTLTGTYESWEFGTFTLKA